MKLRLFGHSIRLRLSRNEVAELAAGTPLRSLTRFFEGELDVHVMLGPALSANFSNGRIRISVPASEVTNWAESDEMEGLYADNGVTKLAIEKDYACLHKPGELAVAENAFPNPAAPDGKIN